ncbi:hypothetical protein [Jeotgalibacillus terrae]|uniref:Uncharacterized protein n=1 Tax=Jeotgalibacillus terrae TaxID=587735 RepID=A0ABW5ZEF1_9BACL|nr:hypothetical protein [Jeotgalibacillus terrae]MBM7577680.1 hypothetical protein [Jeotgalibacillus terrae]
MNKTKLDSLFSYLALLTKLKDSGYDCAEEIAECIAEIRKAFRFE